MGDNIYEFLTSIDPDNFQEEADKIIADFIASCPEEKRKKLEQIQWNLDGELRKYKDPIARMNRMIEIFWAQFNKFQSAMSDFRVVLDEIDPNKK